MTNLLDRGTYPVTLLAAIGMFMALNAVVPATLAGYLAVAFAAVAILILEKVRPYRAAWQPDRPTVVNDALFLVLVQMLLPFLITLPVASILSDRARDVGLSAIWPDSLPIVAQVALMLVVGDFFRYWMHRAAHRSDRLWQFHAVHHSPKRLYWLNVGRFHPLEKVAQMLVDSLPFALLGVSRSVLAGYLVFYAVNGFFQHSNCRVRLGFLNHVVAGPELHRWHHSRIIKESDSNFGNNLIIWDAMFGTRFLPSDREVEELGLLNRSYPQDFVSQLSTPMHYGLEKAEQGAAQ